MSAGFFTMDENNPFITASLKSTPWGKKIMRVLESAIQAVKPDEAIKQQVQLDKNTLIIGNHRIDLDTIDHLYVVGAGKAVLPMTLALMNILDNHVTSGIVIAKENYSSHALNNSIITVSSAANQIRVFTGGHPLPNTDGIRATKEIIDLLNNTTCKDLVLCLISGGGSSLLTSPAGEVTLQDLRTLTLSLTKCGASIIEINILRKHLDLIKGGQLARLAAPAPLISLILSDVVGDPLETIASGPTAPDPSTFQDAWQVLVRYDLVSQLPPSLLHHLERGKRGELPETPKPGDFIFNNVYNVIIGNNFKAAQAALQQAHVEGFNTLLLTTFLQGEARQAGHFLVAIAREISQSGHPLSRPVCLIAGGETTVTIQGKGKGGRNQELALAAVKDFRDIQNIVLVTLATDGEDGNTDAAGAVVTGNTFDRSLMLGMDPESYLRNNDSYYFFHNLDDLIKPGPTHTNVNDLVFIFAY